MAATTKFTRIYQSVASSSAMYALWARHNDAPFDDIRLSGQRDVNTWFEVTKEAFDMMLGLMPPIWLGQGAFAICEAMTDSIHAVFIPAEINGALRFFAGYLDLSDRKSTERLRQAIVERLTASGPSLASRDEKLETIWNTTHRDFRGYAGSVDPDIWDAASMGKRTVLVLREGGTTLVCLEHLNDGEIDRLYNPAYERRSLERAAEAA
ncbi:DUF1419 domain-containing protein [Camelimonas fluminis]|uniref:DUF1419 domain-containing protein n=1 Tax=Camelimonas fluminis TaxID=1576911 RepID=A0ABV7UFJ6_9HYPH|nr:DUF1419 domain-containing protein [Camelimonas fluminis]